MPPVSQILRQTRERLGISLEDVAQRTYIKLPYLIALEEGDVSKLPAQVYIHGYIRQYAKLLDLPGSDLVLQYQQDASLRSVATTRIETRTIPIPVSIGAAAGEHPALPGFATGPSNPVLQTSLTFQDTPRAELPQPGQSSPARSLSEGLSEAGRPLNSPLHASPSSVELPVTRQSEAISRIPAASPVTGGSMNGEPGVRTDVPVRSGARDVELPVLGGSHPPGSGLEMLEARKTAGDIIQQAQREAADFRKAADQYADHVLGQLADEIGRTLQIVRNGKAFLQSRRKQRHPENA